MRVAASIAIRETDWETLPGWSRASTVKAGLAQRRARIVLLAGEGVPNTEIAERGGASRPTVNLWQSRYTTGAVAALADSPGPGRPQRVDEAQVVVRTLQPPPRFLATQSRRRPPTW